MAVTAGLDKDAARRPGASAKGATVLRLRYLGPKDAVEVSPSHAEGHRATFKRGEVVAVPRRPWSERLMLRLDFEVVPDGPIPRPDFEEVSSPGASPAPRQED